MLLYQLPHTAQYFTQRPTLFPRGTIWGSRSCRCSQVDVATSSAFCWSPCAMALSDTSASSLPPIPHHFPVCRDWAPYTAREIECGDVVPVCVRRRVSAFHNPGSRGTSIHSPSCMFRKSYMLEAKSHIAPREWKVGVESKLHVFSTSTLSGGELSASFPGCFTAPKPMWTWCRSKKFLPRSRTKPRSFSQTH